MNIAEQEKLLKRIFNYTERLRRDVTELKLDNINRSKSIAAQCSKMNVYAKGM